MNKYDYIKSLVSECIQESVDEYKVFDGSFDDFKKRYPMHYSTDRGMSQSGGRVYIYNISDYSNLPSIFANGPDRQFTMQGNRSSGEGTDTYGKGFYGTLSYEGTYKNISSCKASSYGGGHPVIVKYVLKNGLKDFLVFNDKIREKNGVKDNVATQLRGHFPPDFLQRYGDSIRSNRVNGNLPQSDKDKGIDMLDLPSEYLMSNGWNSCRNFSDFILPRGSKHDDFRETELRDAGVRGYVSSGMTDNDLIVVKNFKDIMPLAFTDNPVPDESKVQWKTEWSDPSSGEKVELSTEENFNNVNNSEDLIWRYGHKYPDTDMKEPTTAGLVRVKKGGKFNYVNLNNDEELLPVWADSADMINPIGDSKTAKINIGGTNYLMMVNNGGNIFFRKLMKNNATGEMTPVGFPMNLEKFRSMF